MRYTVEMLTPVHIFERRLQSFEIVRLQDGRFGILSEENLSRLLAETGRLRDFCREAAQGRIDVQRFMKRYCLGSRISEVLVRTIDAPGGISAGTIHGAVTDGVRQEPYVPGSSLKGCLRNALIFSLLRADAGALKAEEESIRAEIARGRADRRGVRGLREKIGKPMDSLLQKAHLDGATACNPHTDWLRALRVTDAHIEGLPPIGSTIGSGGPTRLYRTGVVSIAHDARGGRDVAKLKQGLQIVVEALRPGTKLSGQLHVDAVLLKFLRPRGNGRRPFGSAAELIRRLEEFSQNVLGSEIAFFEEFGLPALARRLEALRGKANIRIGWGGGYLARTVALAFDPGLRTSVRDAFYQPRAQAPFPKSRKVIVQGSEPADVLGWARITLGG